MDIQRTPRALSHDEQKAAEAAFGGRPFNPAWSTSAKQIYDGLTQALPKPSDGPGSSTTQSLRETVEATSCDPPPTDTTVPAGAADAQENGALLSQQDAIEAGILIDVTPDAQKLGLAFSVTVTKPLWDIGIAPSPVLSDDEKSARLRDVLMAFRLRLAGQGTVSPLIDFPALLAMPPDSVPQPIALFALIQPDDQRRTMVTLLLPNEVSTTIIPMN